MQLIQLQWHRAKKYNLAMNTIFVSARFVFQNPENEGPFASFEYQESCVRADAICLCPRIVCLCMCSGS